MDTTQIPPDFKEFLRLVCAHDVRFLLIGGYAVSAFGYIRNTIDIDVWIDSDANNQVRVIRAVREFGFSSTGDDVLEDPKAMLRMGLPPLRIQVLKLISGVEFNDCWTRHVELQLDEFVVPMISLNDLKANKRATGRPKDLVDLTNLP